MDPVALFLIFAFAAVGIFVAYHLYNKRRREELAALASSQGLSYDRGDPFGSLSLPFPLFRRGDGRGVENTIWGRWSDEEIRAFEYWFYTESSDSKGNRSRSYKRFSCVLLEVPAHLPDLTVGPEGFFTRLADAVGMDDLGFESEEFNRRYQVKAKVRRFAYELVDARLMKWLLALPGRVSFMTSGPYVLVTTRRLKPAELVALLGTAVSFRGKIPGVVWSLYGVPEG